MAVSLPSPSFPSSSFFPPGDDSPLDLFSPDDSVSIGLYTTFGEDEYSYSTTTSSFGSPWPDPPGYPCCSELEVSSSSFPASAGESFTSMLTDSLPPLPLHPTSGGGGGGDGLPCEDDLNVQLAPEFLEHLGGCNPSTPLLVHSECVDDIMGSLYENQLFGESAGERRSDDDDGDLNGDGGRGLGMGAGGDGFSNVNEEEEASDGVHIPPPLNMKRIEMYDDAYYKNIEAADVPLDVIENKRPFQCGLAGCDKTFKNPQTMKMHHKTHFSDGSAVEEDLPTLKPPYNGTGTGPGSGWMGGRSKKIPSRCPKCRKTFVGLYELRRHYGRKHSEGERPFQCRKCDKRFYVEVDVRDHEKLCGEQIECKCGLKFAFKCNMVAHRKAHPACHQTTTHHSTSATINNATSANSTSTSANSTSVSIMMDPCAVPVLDPLSTSVTIMNPTSDEDSSRSRWISGGTLPLRPTTVTGTKRCHELVEASRPHLMSKLRRVYSRWSTPANNFYGLDLQGDVTSDFALFAESDALWGSYPNLHGQVQWPAQGPVLSSSSFGGADPFQRKLGALDLLELAGLSPGL